MTSSLMMVVFLLESIWMNNSPTDGLAMMAPYLGLQDLLTYKLSTFSFGDIWKTVFSTCRRFEPPERENTNLWLRKWNKRRGGNWNDDYSSYYEMAVVTLSSKFDDRRNLLSWKRYHKLLNKFLLIWRKQKWFWPKRS